jgi:hypothetical protein
MEILGFLWRVPLFSDEVSQHSTRSIFRWTTLLADSSDNNNGNGNKNNNNKNDQVDENDYWYQGVNPVVRLFFGSPIRSCSTCHHELFAHSLNNPFAAHGRGIDISVRGPFGG